MAPIRRTDRERAIQVRRSNRARHVASRAAVVAFVVVGALASATGCSGGERCAPPGTAAAAPAGAVTVNVSTGAVAAMADVRVEFMGEGCDDGPWQAALAVTVGDDEAIESSLEVGSSMHLDDGRALILLSARADGGSIEIALA